MGSNFSEWLAVDWWDVAKVISGSLLTIAVYILKERKNSKNEARSNYQEALIIASKNRDAAQDGVLLLRETIQRILASPRSEELTKARQHFDRAASGIAEPNAKSANEFYDSLYHYDKEMSLAYSRKILKQARHFLSNNEGAYRSMSKQLITLGVTLNLQLITQQST